MNKKRSSVYPRKSCLFLRLFAICMAVLFAVLFIFQPQETYAADDYNIYVYDLQELLTDEEWDTLEKRAESIRDTYGCAVYIMTIDDYTNYGSSVFAVADAVYQEYSFGEGEGHNGVMLLLSMADRDYSTYFYGPVADNAFDSYGQEQMEKEFLDDFADNDWMQGFTDYQNVVEDYLQKAEDGHPVRRSKVPMILICAAFSVIVSLVICLVLRSKSKTVQAAQGAARYASKVNLTGQSERFTHMTTTRTRIERESSSSGSSSHSSSSGGSGRSGKF